MIRFFRFSEWVFVLGCLAFIISLSQSTYRLWQRTDMVREQEGVLNRLQQENLRLKEEVAQVQTPEFIEKEARDKLGLTKPGEQVILFDRQPENTHVSPSAVGGEEKPGISVWWRVFF